MNHGGKTPGQDNLLVVHYRLAHRQQENFTTDSLAHLLRRLVEHEPTVALTGASSGSKQSRGPETVRWPLWEAGAAVSLGAHSLGLHLHRIKAIAE